MITPDLKAKWKDAARNKAENVLSVNAVPATGAFSGYLGRLFKREALLHVDDNNIREPDNMAAVLREIEVDIQKDLPSTGVVAQYTKKVIPDIFLQGTTL